MITSRVLRASLNELYLLWARTAMTIILFSYSCFYWSQLPTYHDLLITSDRFAPLIGVALWLVRYKFAKTIQFFKWALSCIYACSRSFIVTCHIVT